MAIYSCAWKCNIYLFCNILISVYFNLVSNYAPYFASLLWFPNQINKNIVHICFFDFGSVVSFWFQPSLSISSNLDLIHTCNTISIFFKFLSLIDIGTHLHWWILWIGRWLVSISFKIFFFLLNLNQRHIALWESQLLFYHFILLPISTLCYIINFISMDMVKASWTTYSLKLVIVSTSHEYIYTLTFC